MTPSDRILTRFASIRDERPRDIAVFALSEERELSFEDLHREAELTATALAAAGLEPGALVLSLAGNRAASLSLFVACLMRKVVLLALDDSSKVHGDEVTALARRYGARGLVVRKGSGGLPAPGSAGSGSANANTSPIELPGSLRLFRLDHPSRDLAPAVALKLTSGSTGLPRAVRASERHLVNDFRHIAEAMGIGPTDVSYGAIPLWHSYGIGNLVLPLLCQGTPLALRETFLAGRFVDDVRATEASVFPGVPVLFEHLLRSLGARPGLPESLRLLVSAGARLEPSLGVDFERATGVKVHSFYGTSETGGIAYDADEAVSDHPHVGLPLPETKVRIRPEDGRVHVSGTAVADGYVEGDDDDTETGTGTGTDTDSGTGMLASFTEDGFLTGDLGDLDASGRLALRGRVSCFVNVAGRKVDPAECEGVIRQMAGVADVRVLGVPCSQRGQKLVAFVAVSSGGPTAEAVRRHCAEKLSAHKIPREIVKLETLPVTARGKTDRAALEALVAEGPSSPQS